MSATREDEGVRGRRLGAGGDGDAPAVGHRVAGVHDEVQHRLLDAVRVGDDRGGCRVELQFQRDPDPEDLVQQLAHPPDQLMEIERHGFVDPLAAVRHEVVGERRGAIGGALHGVDAGPRGFQHFKIVLQQLDLTAHDREHVVEVVGDAPRESADGLHLLRVEQLLLERFAFGHVAQHDDLEFTLTVETPERRLAELDPDGAATRVEQADLGRLGIAVARRRRGGARELVFTAVVGAEGTERRADQPVVGHHQEVAERAVGLDDAAVDGRDRHGDG